MPRGPRRGFIARIAAGFYRRLRYRVTPSGYLFAAALAIVGAGAIASANNLLFLILAAMLATLLISGFASRLSLAGLELELNLPEHLAARQPVTARIRLRNMKWFPSFAIQLAGQPQFPNILQREIVFPIVPGRSTLLAHAPAVFPKRGVHRENLFVLSTRFPFGFVERRASVSIKSEVIVYPALEPTPIGEELMAELRGDVEREQRGQSADFYRLRPYEVYESARHLDWRSSAHTGELQVREFAREDRSTLYIFFDLQADAGEAFERAIECCAWLVWSLSTQPVRIRFQTQARDLGFPDRVDAFQILHELTLAEAARFAVVPEPEADDPDVLFSFAPERFEAAGWRPSRVLNYGRAE